MCLAIPMKIEKIEKAQALALAGPVRARINIQLIGKVRPGDYVLVHAGLAIEKINGRKAKAVLALHRKIKII